MPEVRSKLKGVGSDDAKKPPPRREPIEPGCYHALIMGVKQGVTRYEPVQDKISVEFQILHRADDGDEKYAGRRVWQDYVLEPVPGQDDESLRISKVRRYELRQLLDASDTPYSEDSETDEVLFNTDHMMNKAVKIWVHHRYGKQKDEHGKLPVFENVRKVDTAEEADDEELV